MIQKALKVLLIEDNPDDVVLLRHYLANLSSARIEFEPVERLARALERLSEKEADIDVILMDLGLPDSQGLETFIKVRQGAPKVPIVVLSGQGDESLAIQAVREGAQDYLVKGQVDGELLVRALHYAVERLRIEEALRQARDELEVRVQERTAELALANEALKKMIIEVSRAGEELQGALLGIIHVICLTIEARDPYTAGHQRGVADLACAIARIMGLSAEKIEGIRLAAIIHDLGKISIPAEILAKPARLNEVEMSMIQLHPRSGYDILKKVEFPWPIAQIILQHHERINGSGYPQGLGAADIIPEAKIIGVADVVEAMCSHRPYRPALGIDAALAEIRRNRGLLYDPAAVDACVAHFKEAKATLAEKDKGFYIKVNFSQPPPPSTP